MLERGTIMDVDKQARIKRNRAAITEEWTDLNYIKTDRQNKLDRPNMYKQPLENQPRVELDRVFPNVVQKTLHECIQNRRSLRNYSQKSLLSKEEVSYLLYETSRVMSYKPGVTFRTIPTGGATNAMETYIYVNQVDGLNKGLYLYVQDKHTLALMDNKDDLEQRVNDALLHQLRGASIVVIFSAVPYRSEYKYAFAAHKMIAMEAGHACQNLSLAAEVVDSGVCAIAAYSQKLMDPLLQLDGIDEFVTYAVTVGKK